MIKIKTFSAEGTKLADTALPKEFAGDVNRTLLTQAVRVYEDRGHLALSRVKTRAEVIRTKKKWYKQKGTGGARHGARSAPIFVGGGVAHGPKGVKRQLVLPKKLKQQAKISALASRAKSGDLVFVDGVAKISKTAQAQKLVNVLAMETSGKRFTLVLSDAGGEVRKSFRNIKNVDFLTFKSINAYNIFFGGVIIFDKSIFEVKAPAAKKVKKPKTEKVKKGNK